MSDHKYSCVYYESGKYKQDYFTKVSDYIHWIDESSNIIEWSHLMQWDNGQMILSHQVVAGIKSYEFY